MPSAVVIGAGPGGSVAATLLARGGWDVTVLEKSRFPRHKVCGECLSATGLDVLDRLRLGIRCGEGLAAVPHAMLRRSVVYAGTGPSVGRPLPRAMCGVRRDVLDALLLNAARDAGAHVRQPARAEKVETRRDDVRDGGPGDARAGVEVVVRSAGQDVTETLRADVVIVADGTGALAGGVPRATGDVGVKAHLSGVASTAEEVIELFALRGGGYVGLAPIGEGVWNLAAAVPKHRLGRSHDLTAFVRQVLREHPTLARRCREARTVGPVLASGLPRFGVRGGLSASARRGVYAVGNAASAIEPIGGEGMGLAMASAERLATRLLAGEWSSPAGAYRRLWGLRGVACRAVAVAVSRPRVGEALVTLAAGQPGLTRWLASQMGKSDSGNEA